MIKVTRNVDTVSCAIIVDFSLIVKGLSPVQRAIMMKSLYFMLFFFSFSPLAAFSVIS
ncbi:hypothetical protein JCM19237_1156 [Photobacterium aphoticum]|uniref:Uncharacterized protein n=1 Tax=Photobacterium aphoticum TaxID=754436 RepID=A0A090QRS1_9GAMM|nr:hypothetical protein JCM19237_1156 [Photobacterium aphoticum]